ncbi:plasmid and phage DNA primase [Novosphingobium aromaticivorans DSM 12444]|uniref:DNA primase n=1 Tax=Novosphingobium aromaticivorans (strain ATCC 700278 / DSM 12444 / CCUG 56034 / CIP 105152 / NBRC 16084 / F199) TaxID=279238 RepID=Q2GAN5_NOVAD|nr:DNA primase [Novosphingobium aromaticivorans]ABD25088.1 plasmid and phage DNA primase [Novosphingobium aromaticivorans DSM 12444]SCY95995.1 plasmid and phage DNA primase [Novosphingobium aromaticivorans]
MAIPHQFLDELRSRTTLSALIAQTLKIDKAGREFKACCPFHGEKTPSFTINDAKGFYHCFGCGAHGDAIRWMIDQRGLQFIDAVSELASAAGMKVPAPTPQERERSAKIETVREALDIAQGIFVGQLREAGAVMQYLERRGMTPMDLEIFGIGYARGMDGSLRGSGIGRQIGQAAGLLSQREDGSLREMFHDRVTVPIHDARGRLVGFGGRVWPGRRRDTPKFVNSPDSPIFDKGRTLFNLHRAAPAARPGAENRLIVVEGYFDVVSMARAGFAACVAPMGTALTEEQLVRCWRLHHRPVLLFDGDSAGQKAAVRACRTAIPGIGPGRELAIALLPDGKDPDELLYMDATGMGRRAIEAIVTEALPLHTFLFDAIVAEAGANPTPEQTAAVWAELAALAGEIADEETRCQYLGTWRARFEREISALPQVHEAEPLHAVVAAEDGEYVFPESESDSQRRLIALVRAVLKKREERREINEEIADLMKMAELAGFQKKAISAAVADIESDMKHGPAKREEDEMQRVLYRRVLGIRGPMTEAMMPQLIDGTPRGASAQVKRRATVHALIDARASAV